MSSSAELLALRLGLIAIIFVFVLVVALTLRSGVRLPRPGLVQQATARRGPRLVLMQSGDTGLAPGTEFQVAGVMSLGRDPSNGIVLVDASVSTRHAEVERRREGWLLTDLGSTNGTFVNGRSINGRGVLLRGGEEIAFGSVVVRFQA